MDIYDQMKPTMRNNEVVWRHFQRNVVARGAGASKAVSAWDSKTIHTSRAVSPRISIPKDLDEPLCNFIKRKGEITWSSTIRSEECGWDRLFRRLPERPKASSERDPRAAGEFAGVASRARPRRKPVLVFPSGSGNDCSDDHKAVAAICPVGATNQRSLLNGLPLSRATNQSATRVGGNGPKLVAGTLPTECRLSA